MDFLADGIFREVIGSVAAFLTTVAFLPQTVKVLRERQTQAISLSMYVIFTCGVALWLVYGLLLGSYPIIIANIFTLTMAAIILTMKLRYG